MIYLNSVLEEDFRRHLIKHYRYDWKIKLEEMEYIPYISYVLAYLDEDGNELSGCRTGYILSEQKISYLKKEIIFSFDDRNRFFAVRFNEEFDPNAIYNFDYYDGIIFIIKSQKHVRAGSV